MTSEDSVMRRLREFCLALPDSTESEKWGKPHFCVCEKIFAGCSSENDRLVIGFKLQKPRAAATVQLPGFSVAPYVGRHGWVSMDTSVIDDRELIEDMIMESYRLIAPAKSLAKLDSSG